MKRTFSKVVIVAVLASFALAGCVTKSSGKGSHTASNIQLFDRNGFSETISNKEKLAKLEKSDLLSPQPYRKIVKMYEKDAQGKTPGVIVTYHPNGQPWQFLETLNGRAFGVYHEWFSNGNPRMEARVIEGVGDIASESQLTWVFDEKSNVWDEEGNLVAEISYDKGKLQDDSIYYHPNGQIAKTIPYKSDKIEGLVKFFSPTGEELGYTLYVDGIKGGSSVFMGNDQIPAREEEYKSGLLLRGKYWDLDHEQISEVISGNGIKPVYENGMLSVEYEYRNGKPEGEVKTYRQNGMLENISHVIDGQKQGEEWCYYDKRGENGNLVPLLYLNWSDDEIHGTVRTWYPNGVLESEKEMSHNKKQGVLLAWYSDSTLMIVEHYDNDELRNGKYFKKGDDVPVSRVIGGSGTATIYDSEGRFVRKIEYRKGQPLD